MARSKAVRVAIVAMLVGAIVGCGGGNSAGSDSAQSTPSGTPTETVSLPSSLAIAAPEEIPLGSPLALGLAFGTTNAGNFTYLWSFGDGTTSTEATPVHSYTAPGDFVIELRVMDSSGASKTTQKTLRVSPNQYITNSICNGLPSTGWCWQAPTTTANAINNVYFVDSNNGWAVGAAGLVLKTSDSGLTWSKVLTPTERSLLSVKFTDAQNGWILADSGMLLHTLDGGRHWSTTSISSSNWYGYNYRLIVRGQTIVVATEYYTYVSTDNGNTWTSVSTLFNLDVFEATGKQVALNWYSLEASSDFFQTSKTSFIFPRPHSSYMGVSFANELEGMITTTESRDTEQHVITWKTSDGGQTWNQVNDFISSGYSYDTGSPIKLLKHVTPQKAWMVVGEYPPKLFLTKNGGQSWSEVGSLCGYDPYAWGFSSLPIIKDSTLVQNCGTGFQVTEDDGVTWQTLKVDGITSSAYAINQLDRHVFIVKYPSGSYLTQDNGSTWKKVLHGNDNQVDFGGVWFFDKLQGIAVAGDQSVIQTNDGGQTWSALSSITTGNTSTAGDNIRSLQFTSRKTGWILRAGVPYKTTDGGASWWVPAASLRLSEQVAIHFLDDNTGWSLSSYGRGLYQTQDGGGQWKKLTPIADTDLRSIAMQSSTKGVVGGSRGTIWRTTDGGVTWLVTATDSTSTITDLKFATADIGWAMSEVGEVFKTTDGGATWIKQTVPGSSYYQKLYVLDANHVWTVGLQGSLLATKDGGNSWAQQGNGIATDLRSVFFVDANTGWVVGSNGSILATRTGGF